MCACFVFLNYFALLLISKQRLKAYVAAATWCQRWDTDTRVYPDTTRLPPPGEFNLSKWPKWRRRFEQYRSASGLDGETETRQVDTLLYCLGDEADSVLASTNISDDVKMKYEEVIEKFDSYFQVRRNVIFERVRFNQRSHRRENLQSNI